jgi:hypothetical protein
MQNSTNSRLDSQDPNISVAVDLRRRESPTSAVKAHADVEIRFGSSGSVNILGFSIYHVDGKPPVVLPPAQKGERKSFPHVRLTGKVGAMVASAILREYESAMAVGSE